MSRARRVPKYRHYKPKNLGVVRLDGHDHYLGEYDSAQSWEKYHRLVAEWLGHFPGAVLPPAPTKISPDQPTINEVILTYWKFAEQYYVHVSDQKEVLSWNESEKIDKPREGLRAIPVFGGLGFAFRSS